VVSFEAQPHLVVDITRRKIKNLFIINAAVSFRNGVAFFDMSTNDAAASLNQFSDPVKKWTGQKIMVATVRLDAVLECIPIKRIEYFLCDAQGSDLDVMKSAGEHLRRIDKIRMEVQVNTFRYYVSENSKPAVVAYMKSMGFAETDSDCNGILRNEWLRDKSKCEEENVTFQPVKRRDA